MQPALDGPIIKIDQALSSVKRAPKSARYVGHMPNRQASTQEQNSRSCHAVTTPALEALPWSGPRPDAINP